MEGLTDAWIAARRCLAAMDETQDVETRAALWRAALRYASKNREDVRGLEIPHALPGRANL